EDARVLLGGKRAPRAAESAQQIRERGRKRAEDTRSQRRNEFIEQSGALLRARVVEKMGDHFAERRRLFRPERFREPLPHYLGGCRPSDLIEVLRRVRGTARYGTPCVLIEDVREAHGMLLDPPSESGGRDSERLARV